MVVAREYSVFSTGFNTCLPYFKIESKITLDYEAQCSLFTYNVLYKNIDQKLVNSLHRLLNCEKGGLDWHVITTEYRTRV